MVEKKNPWISSPDHPYYHLSGTDALNHYNSGLGVTLYVDMSAHMTEGPGRLFGMDDFATSLGPNIHHLDVGEISRFETNPGNRAYLRADKAVASLNMYSMHGVLSEEAYVWGETSAGFRGSVEALGDDLFVIKGEIRPFNEQFGFENNTWNPFLETARTIGGIIAGLGYPYKIAFVGQGKPVFGVFELIAVDTASGPVYYLSEVKDQCFPAHTPILTSLTTTTAIATLHAGDTVLSFDQNANKGRGGLVPRRVKRLFRNTTTEWIVLRWVEAGIARELTLTPGHHVLDQYGQFPTIEAMLLEGTATVVLASGALAEVTAVRIVYSAATAHLYERAQSVGVMAGNAALQPVLMDAWQTYNFEVEDLHTYVAGGVRVHNDSGLMGWIGNQTDDAIDTGFGFARGSAGDIATDVLTAPLHMVGELLDLGVKAVDGLARAGLWLADQLGVGITDPNWTQIVGPGPVAHSNEIAHATGPHTSVYDKDSPFAGQPVQAGGDTDHDHQLEPGDKFLHDAGIYDRQAAEARANGNPLQAQYYEGRAERARAQAAALQFPDNGSDDDDNGSPLAPDTSIRPQPNPRHTNTVPILLDLDGNGIKVTDLPRSTVFMVDDEGLKHRTAWAGKGDGVLFYDVGNDGKIEETREYVFTEWDPTARSDFEALRARFDSNNDGRLTSADAEFSKFKVLVTKADGSQTAQTLTQLGIWEINLRPDTTQVTLPYGSRITGQAGFMINGQRRMAADMVLMAEAQGYDVTEAVATVGQYRRTTLTGVDDSGDLASIGFKKIFACDQQQA